MSSTSTPVDAALHAYVEAHTRGDDAFLVELRAAARAARLPDIAIAAAQASAMQILLQLAGARRVVEVGTLGGYSAIQMARALPADGELVTIELEPKHAAFAREWIARSDVAARVRVVEGSGRDVLPTLPTAWADACFLDADKAGYSEYLCECLRIVRPGGLVMADNAFAFGELLNAHAADGGVAAIRAFNELVPRIRNLHAVIAPFGDGLWIGVIQGGAAQGCAPS
ncbi:MAG: O-methyltransferase [Planctomycetota bacterium]|nr:MAG: O-methyltransferase [Planctomycetota bacterium]